VWKIAFVHILFTIIIGLILYWCLLFIVGWCTSRRLRKRRISSVNCLNISKSKIILIYFFVLSIIIILCFLNNKFFIRGVNEI
jgi:hypothetical protein